MALLYPLCKNGHELRPENCSWVERPKRFQIQKRCKTCENMRALEKRLKKMTPKARNRWILGQINSEK